ncbi:N-acetyltransferase family protein [Fluviicola sp.]|uniref:GNAT family N-acetyltransferase n=1 Tax=Fluviicola sp. TaxID=1917219 RepID=UPI003D271F91
MEKTLNMITIRTAGKADISKIEEIAKKTWPIAYKEVISSEQIRYMLDLMYNKAKIEAAIQDPNQAFWLAEKQGETLGFCGIEVHNPTSEYLRIHKLYVLPHTQGLGIGKLLVEKVMEEAQSHGLHLLHLNVNKKNKAYYFYQKLGFKIDHEEVIDIGNGFVMDDFVMVKDLS